MFPFAWYTATANFTGAKAATQGPTGILAGSENTAQTDNLFLKLTATVDSSDTCYLTTSDGYVYYVDAGSKLRGPIQVASDDKADLYGEITFSAAFYSEAAASNLASSAQLNTLAEGSLTFTLGSSEGSRTRLAAAVSSISVTNSPYAVSNFATVFGSSYENTLSVTVAWTAKAASFTVSINSGAATAIGSAKVYYAIGGTATIASKADQDAIVAAGTTVTADSSLTGSLTIV